MDKGKTVAAGLVAGAVAFAAYKIVKSALSTATVDADTARHISALASMHAPAAPKNLSLSEAKGAISAILDEYLLSADGHEVVRQLRGISSDASLVGVETVKRTCYLLCDRKDEDGERLAALIVFLVLHGVLARADVETGLQVVVGRLHDIRLDNPRAPSLIADLVAWLVASDAISADLLSESSAAAYIAAAAGSTDDSSFNISASFHLINQSVREVLDSRVPTPLAQLRGHYDAILAHFLAGSGAGLDTLLSQLASMQSRHTLYEFVRKIVVACVEGHARSNSKQSNSSFGTAPPEAVAREICSDLLGCLHGIGLITSFDAAVGFLYVLRNVSELCLDVPSAPIILGKCIARAVADGVLPSDFASKHHKVLNVLGAPPASEHAPAPTSATAGIPRSSSSSSTGSWVQVGASTATATDSSAAASSSTLPRRLSTSATATAAGGDATAQALSTAASLLPSDVAVVGVTSDVHAKMGRIWGLAADREWSMVGDEEGCDGEADGAGTESPITPESPSAAAPSSPSFAILRSEATSLGADFIAVVTGSSGAAAGPSSSSIDGVVLSSSELDPPLSASDLAAAAAKLQGLQSGKEPDASLVPAAAALAVEGNSSSRAHQHAAVDPETAFARRLGRLVVRVASTSSGEASFDGLHNEVVRSLISSALVSAQPTSSSSSSAAAATVTARVCSLLSSLRHSGALSEPSLRTGIARVLEQLFFDASADAQTASIPVLTSILLFLTRTGCLSASPSFFDSLPRYLLDAAAADDADAVTSAGGTSSGSGPQPGSEAVEGLSLITRLRTRYDAQK